MLIRGATFALGATTGPGLGVGGLHVHAPARSNAGGHIVVSHDDGPVKTTFWITLIFLYPFFIREVPRQHCLNACGTRINDNVSKNFTCVRSSVNGDGIRCVVND